MRLSTLIKHLQTIQSKHGNLEVFNEGDHHWMLPLCKGGIVVGSPSEIARMHLSEEPKTKAKTVVAISA